MLRPADHRSLCTSPCLSDERSGDLTNATVSRQSNGRPVRFFEDSSSRPILKGRFMGRTGPLLSLGNGKLGAAIHSWSVPAIDTCPGSSSLCRAACYATRHRFRFQQVRDQLEWCLEQSRMADFVDRMVAEIRSCGVLVLRLHVAGDFYDAQYAEKWLAVTKRCPRVRFYGYSRSWRVPAIAAVLEKMAALRCCRLWYSVDSETDLPECVPPGVRLAYLQIAEGRIPEQADLVFRIRKLRKLTTLPIVCDQETTEGKASRITCGACTRCFR